MEKKYRIPRKLKKKIPKGHYCYKPLGYNIDGFTYNIKPCEFYTSIKMKNKPENQQDEITKEYPEEFVGWCKLIKYEVDDQCKSCGFKY